MVVHRLELLLGVLLEQLLLGQLMEVNRPELLLGLQRRLERLPRGLAQVMTLSLPLELELVLIHRPLSLSHRALLLLRLFLTLLRLSRLALLLLS
jgi:hypothetical protein